MIRAGKCVRCRVLFPKRTSRTLFFSAVDSRMLGRVFPHPGFSFDAELQQDGEEGECGDGRAPGEQIHI